LEDLLDPLDQEVHHERLGQTGFIILVIERQVDHDAVVFIELIFFICTVTSGSGYYVLGEFLSWSWVV
jgi:hypothetical protein